jgi:diguanylate cyclase (GGDEF)-like protein
VLRSSAPPINQSRRKRRHVRRSCGWPTKSIGSPRSSNNRARIVDLEGKVDTDQLTELLNRRSFERELKRSVAYVKRYGTSAALVYLDLDGFKPVNDRHGHAAGDAVLKAVAAALVRNVRASDDEFVVLLWNVSGPAAAAKAAGLEQAVYSTPARWGSSTLVVGASAGVVLIGALDEPAELLARADAAMYARKGARRGEPRQLAQSRNVTQ